jgi:hypothetical protein
LKAIFKVEPKRPGGDFSLESPGGDVVYDMERGIALASQAPSFATASSPCAATAGLVDYNTNLPR